MAPEIATYERLVQVDGVGVDAAHVGNGMKARCETGSVPCRSRTKGTNEKGWVRFKLSVREKEIEMEIERKRKRDRNRG